MNLKNIVLGSSALLLAFGIALFGGEPASACDKTPNCGGGSGHTHPKPPTPPAPTPSNTNTNTNTNVNGATANSSSLAVQGQQQSVDNTVKVNTNDTVNNTNVVKTGPVTNTNVIKTGDTNVTTGDTNVNNAVNNSVTANPTAVNGSSSSSSSNNQTVKIYNPPTINYPQLGYSSIGMGGCSRSLTSLGASVGVNGYDNSYNPYAQIGVIIPLGGNGDNELCRKNMQLQMSFLQEQANSVKTQERAKLLQFCVDLQKQGVTISGGEFAEFGKLCSGVGVKIDTPAVTTVPPQQPARQLIIIPPATTPGTTTTVPGRG